MNTRLERDDPRLVTRLAAEGHGVHIMGSRTFRDMAAYWPSATGPFAAPMNEIPKVVFSRTGRPDLDGGAGTRGLDDARAQVTSPSTTASPEIVASWTQARVASGPLAEEVARLKREPGRPIIAHAVRRSYRASSARASSTSIIWPCTRWRWGADRRCSRR